MNELKKSIHDNANGLDYTLVNDHYLPNLTAAAPAEHPTGRWGRLHKMYLKEQHPIRYNQLLLSGELGGYLAKLDKQAEEQLALTVRQMQEAEGVTEALKAANQLDWVRRMNSIPDIHGSPVLHRQAGRSDICCSTAERPPKSAPLKNEAVPLTHLKVFLCPAALSFFEADYKNSACEKSHIAALYCTLQVKSPRQTE